MRRYSFYLSIALLAFGIGSFVGFKFYWKTVEQHIPVEQSGITEEIKNNSIKDDSDAPSDEQLLEWRRASFETIITKWLEKKNIKQYVELKRDDKWAAFNEHEARVELIDVNGDRVEELVIQTGCSAVGNCDLWIFEKYMHGYNEILKAYMVQTIKLKNTKTNGYFDLEAKSHGDSTSGGIAVYKFNKEEYKIDKCFAYEYEMLIKKNRKPLYTKDGQRIFKDIPTKTPASCENW